MIQTIILFFAIILGLGFGVKYSLKLRFENIFEEIIMVGALGIGVFPILGVTINLIGIPLHWSIFLFISIVGISTLIITKLIKKEKITFLFNNIELKKNWHLIIVFGMFLLCFFVMVKGSFAYPYLENDDPWAHAMAAKYVSLEMTTDEPSYFDFHYLDPYPPTYSILMGILHQTNDSIYTTLKLFNSLLIALGILFFYFFLTLFMKNKNKAIFGTFILLILPSFMSHFIWSQTLAIILFFPAWYFLLKFEEDIEKIKTQIRNQKNNSFRKTYLDNFLINKWGISTTIIIASILVVQPSAAFVFGAMSGLYIIFKILKKKYELVFPFLLGTLLSMIYWIPMILRYGLRNMLVKIGLMNDYLTGANTDTSGGVVYNLMDFIVAPSNSRIDQATGWGIVISILLILSIIIIALNYKKLIKSEYLGIGFTWFLFALIGTQSNALPFKLLPHRFWVFLAIPVAIIVAEGIEVLRISINNKSIKTILISILIIGIIWTSGVPKYKMQTSPYWVSGAIATRDEAIALSWLQNDKGARTFMMIDYNEEHVIGNDNFNCIWCIDIYNFRKKLWNNSVDEIILFLRNNNYKYFAIGGFTFRNYAEKYGVEETEIWGQNFIEQIQNSTELTVAHQANNVIILRIN